MKKIDNEFEHYELLTKGSGCLIASVFIISALIIILVAWSFV